jgi:hypothetical protein
VVAGYGAAETDLFVYAGIANQRLSNAALRTYTSEGAATLNLGIATGGDLTGTGSATAQDIVLGAPAAAAGNGRTYVIPNTAPNGTTLAPGGVVLSYTGAAGGNNVGSAVLALDYNGDGQEDLLSGDNGGAVVDIFFGPIATNLNNPNDIDLQFTGNGNFGQSIVSCDVNGDGVSDLLIGNSGADLFMLAGLE